MGETKALSPFSFADFIQSREPFKAIPSKMRYSNDIIPLRIKKITTLITLMITQSSQFSTYLRVIKIIATTERIVMAESQNGNASGSIVGIAKLVPNRFNISTAQVARTPNTAFNVKSKIGTANTEMTSVTEAFGKLNQQILIPLVRNWSRLHAYQP